MATLDWIVLIVCSTGILYCVVTMPRPIILTREEWLKLPERTARREQSDRKS